MKLYDSHFTPAAAEKLRQSIEAACGREVFARGIVEDGLITDVVILARGNEHCVAAIMSQCQGGEYAIHNHPPTPGVPVLENLRPSDADVGIASQLGQAGIGSMIVDNDVRHSNVIVEAVPAKKMVPIPLEKVEELLAPGGKLSKIFKHYESRPEQLAMLRTVTNAFNEKNLSVVEAGTGTGKTIAYLIPAIIWTLLNNTRVVIATHTINLQEQLFLKDFPLAARLFKEAPKAVLAKGRGNFVCLRKANKVFREPGLFDAGELGELENLAKWAVKSETGDRQEPAEWPESNIWEQICSTSESCVKKNCPYSKECFVTKARRNADDASIIITNHALLFSDIAIRLEGGLGILPNYDAIIIDEAHNLEDSATNHFGGEVRKLDIIRTLNAIYQKNGHKESGALFLLNNFIEKNEVRFSQELQTLREAYQKVIREGMPLLNDGIREECDAIHDVLMKMEAAAKLSGKSVLPYRLKKARREGEDWEEISARLKNLEGALAGAGALFKIFFDCLENKVEEGRDELPGLLTDLKVRTSQLDKYSAFIAEIREHYDEDAGVVSWIDAGVTRKHVRWLTVKSVPITVGEQLKEQVYKKFQTVILTSATLSIQQSLDFFKSRVGLDLYEKELAETGERKLTFDIYPSSFDYARQAALLLPSNGNAFLQDQGRGDLNAAILKLLELTNGGAFVLFTAQTTMQRIFDDLEPALRKKGMVPFLQGRGSRLELLSNFKKTPNAVLFGLDSFWAGVDVSGERLRNVIVTKLPFPVPSEPIQEARCEELEQRGLSPFPRYSVPQAVIKLRQGFGRLIRSKQDSGIVAILDDRIITARYGKAFLESLPKCQEARGSLEEVLAFAEQFLAREK